MSALRLELLGGLRLLTATGAAIALPARKPALLLAYLSLRPSRAEGRARLAALFWGDSSETRARSSLRQALRVLRELVHPHASVLSTPDGDTVALVPGLLETDVAHFERCLERRTREALMRAAALYAGDLLEGHEPREPMLHEWLVGERQRLRDRAIAAMSALLEAALQDGPFEVGTSLALRVLALDPLREEAHRALMQLYSREGRLGAALRQYETCRDLLRRELGVAPEAETQRLYLELRNQRAVASRVRAPAPASPGTTGAPTEPAEALVAATGSTAERRQLTVLVCDIVASDPEGLLPDPEELHPVLPIYQAIVRGVARQFSGHVATLMADSGLLYFGWPTAVEDAAERAVRAGLELTAQTTRLSAEKGIAVAARVGIATGVVIVGDVDGQVERGAVIGPTPRLAGKLKELAGPNQVVVSGATKRLVGGMFEVAILAHAGPTDSEATPWRVIADAPVEDRFRALHPQATHGLVGRDQELALLLDRWQLARAGDGQVVELLGEAGIGKSRILSALRDRLHREALTTVQLHCSPHHSNSPLWPMGRYLERAGRTGEMQGLPPHQRLAQLLTGCGPEGEDAVPLLAELIGSPPDTRSVPAALDPTARKRIVFRALIAHFEAMARLRPLLLVLEDAQWLDPTTRELLDTIVAVIAARPVLIVVTARPGGLPLWAGHAHVTTLTLSRLVPRHVETLVRSVAGPRPLPREIVAAIQERTDGVPLFVEELTRAVIEAGEFRDGSAGTDPVPPLAATAIPATLHDSLMARLDRLNLVKEVAQTAACIGRDFNHELLAAVVEQPDEQLLGALDQLVAAQLVFRRGTPPTAEYSFKHALVRDSAYWSLLRSRRQAIHARIAVALEKQLPDLVAARPEIVAHHCSEGGLIEKAVAHWHRAGRQAMLRSAMVEALAQLNHGLDLLGGLDDGRRRGELELDLRVALAGALSAARGWAAGETGEALVTARRLCTARGDTARLFPVLMGQWSFHLNRVEMDAAQAVADELLRLAGEHGDRAAMVMGHRISGTTLLHCGRLGAARAQLEQCLALYEPIADRALAFRYAHLDPRAAGLGFLAWTLLLQGFPEQAKARSGEALDWASELGHVATRAFALHWAAALHQICNEPAAVGRHAEALVALAAEHRQPMALALGNVMHGWALAATQGDGAGLAELRSGLTDYQRTGAALWTPHLLAVEAASVERQGRSTEALALVENALVRVERSGERWLESDLLRRRGLLQLACGDAASGEDSLHAALTLAREQGAGLWELRALAALAHLLAARGERADAHRLLAPICMRLTEGAERRAARQLLATLA